MVNCSRITGLVLAGLLHGGIELAVFAADKVTFEDHVKPILREKCFACHNTNKKTSDLDLSSWSSLMQGGASGAVIQPGSAADSYLFRLMSHESEPFMPPESERLPDAVLETVRAWIDAGAPETSSSRVVLPQKPTVNLSVDVAAGIRPEGPEPMPDVLSLEPVVHARTATAVSALASSPWAKLIAVAGQKQILLYHSETLEPLGVLPFPEGQARVLKFSRSGALLLAGGGRGAAKGLAVVWNVRSGERVMELGDELDEVLAADISADQTMVALGGPQKIVRVYNTASGELLYELTKHTDWIYALEFSPDSVLLATSDRNGGLHVWESFTGREYLTLAGHTGPVNSVSWRIDGNVLASASQDTTIRLWEMENGGQIKSWGAHGGGVFSVEFCRDGRLVSAGRDRITKMWDQNGGILREFEPFSDLALQVTHCDETNRVAAGDWTGEIRVWNAADGVRVGLLSPNPPPLEERAASEQTLLDAARQKSLELRQAHATALKAQEAQQQLADAAVAALTASQQAVAERQAAILTVETSLSAEIQNEKGLREDAESLTIAVPDLQFAAAKAAAAASARPADSDVVQLAARLQELALARADAAVATQTRLAASQALVSQLTLQLEALRTELPVLEQTLVATMAAAEQATASRDSLVQASAAAGELAAAAESEVTRLENRLNRWTSYVALRNDLAALDAAREERDAVQLRSLEAAARVSESRMGLAERQASLLAVQQMAVKTAESVSALKTRIADAADRRAADEQQLAARRMAQTVLEAALERARAAVSLLPEDLEVKHLADSLAAGVSRQAQTAAVLTEQIAALNEAIIALEKQRDTEISAVAAAEDQIVQDQQQIDTLTAALEMLEQERAAADAELAVAERAVSAALEVVTARRQAIRPQLLQVLTQNAGG